jgi:hypothetical protein
MGDGRPVIAATAISYRGIIFTLPKSHRHHQILHAMPYLGNPKTDRDQGVITDEGIFVEWPETLEIAMVVGQLKGAPHQAAVGLFSEDMW